MKTYDWFYNWLQIGDVRKINKETFVIMRNYEYHYLNEGDIIVFVGHKEHETFYLTPYGVGRIISDYIFRWYGSTYI